MRWIQRIASHTAEECRQVRCLYSLKKETTPRIAARADFESPDSGQVWFQHRCHGSGISQREEEHKGLMERQENRSSTTKSSTVHFCEVRILQLLLWTRALHHPDFFLGSKSVAMSNFESFKDSITSTWRLDLHRKQMGLCQTSIGPPFMGMNSHFQTIPYACDSHQGSSEYWPIMTISASVLARMT